MVLIEPCRSWLQDTNITISPHDGPSVLMSYKQKALHYAAAAHKTTLDARDADEVDEDARYACGLSDLRCDGEQRAQLVGLSSGVLARFPPPSVCQRPW
jgi:hypothetical protein